MNACCVYDFTYHLYERDPMDIIKLLKQHCKKFSFQLERGEKTGKKHYQGRFSLKIKKRLTDIPFKLGHFSITSKANQNNDFYVTKEDTRIEGPWTDKDEVTYIPRQVREINNLYPWQQQVIDSIKIWDTRHINVVVCSSGNIGKSTLVSYMRAHKLGTPLPPVNDYKDMLRIVYALAKDSNNCFLIDQPRSQKKDKLFGFYSGIETIKDGYAYDDRFTFKQRVFDCPVIWVFTNIFPEKGMLSEDRWKYWQVRKNKLEPYGTQNAFDSDSEEL